MNHLKTLVASAGALLLSAMLFVGCGCDDIGGCVPLTITIDRSMVPQGGSVEISDGSSVVTGCDADDEFSCDDYSNGLWFDDFRSRPKQVEIRIFDADGLEIFSTVVAPSYTETIHANGCSEFCRDTATVTVVPEG